MLTLAGRPDADVEEALRDGRAMDAWRDMIRAQDGDPDAALPAPRESHTVTASTSGVITRLDALPFGVAAWRLGAGRARAEDAVVHAAGIDLHVKPGDRVAAGQPVFTLVADDESRFERALAALDGAWAVGSDAAPRGPLVRERITA
jgi:thymidine phosphorylase